MAEIVLVEVNEVPNVVLDAYAEKSSFMRDFLKRSRRFDTVAADQVQLDPWIAWPTFHRGVPDVTHKLLRLGQNSAAADASFPPIWRTLASSGRSVGVYGSLFSNTETDQAIYDFFVPDVFSPHSRVKPRSLERFQEYNLAMTRASGRNPSKGLGGGAIGSAFQLAATGQLRPSTMLRAASQILAEKMIPARLSRRRNIQTELHGDVFLSLWRKHRPEFSTFYTNNVAAAMHRFWSASFTEGSINSARLDQAWVRTYGGEVFEALHSVERLLRGMMKLPHPPIIVLGSAIGQEEIPAENHAKFISIVDVQKFISTLAPEILEADYQLLPTMVPDFSIRFGTESKANIFRNRLAVVAIGGNPAVKTLERMKAKDLEFDDRVGHLRVRHDYLTNDHFKHAVTFESSDRTTVHLSVQIDDFSGVPEMNIDAVRVPFAQAGIGEIMHAEGVNCTAQHCAIGSMAIHGVASVGMQKQTVSVLDFVPSLLKHFGVVPPAALPGHASIQFT
jgi:hypothetical protein